MSQSLYSYVVAFDSGFAPNPFYGVCTLATCKPPIRKSAKIGDWIVGTGSANRNIGRGGYLVHAMQVTDTISIEEYWSDNKFQCKKPVLTGSWKTAAGDNIYEPKVEGSFAQLDSYHSEPNGSPRSDHIAKDTRVPRILLSENFVYFGGEGPKLPTKFLSGGAFELLKSGVGYFRKQDEDLIVEFEDWFKNLGVSGFQGEPLDWLKHYE